LPSALAIGHIGGQELGAGAPGAERGEDVRTPLFGASVDGHLRAATREAQGDTLAETLGGAGDERDATVQMAHVSRSRFCSRARVVRNAARAACASSESINWS
jgi:hypothetical protein